MAKRHILQLIASSHGGGASHLLDLVTLLPKNAFEVTVVMPEDGGNVSQEQIEAAGASFLPLPIASGFNFHAIRRVRQVVTQGRFHLIHVHGARAGLYGRLPLLTLATRPKVVFSIHGFATPYYAFPKKQLYLGIEHLLQRVTDHTLCVAQAERDLFLSYGLSNRASSSVIYPGIQLERFTAVQPANIRQSLGLTKDAQLILTVCRLNIPRDFETLLTAVFQTRQSFPNLHLLIAGDGPLRGQIEAKVAALQLQNHVHLLGIRHDIPTLLAAADLFTLTSSGWEGFPISTLEAQAAGCPVVVSDAGGASEAVRHQESGLVVPKLDAAALAAAFDQLLSNDGLRKKMGKQGQRRAQALFSREKMVAGITAVYDGLTSSPQKSKPAESSHS